MRLDISEASVFVACVAEAANQKPLERVALEFVVFYFLCVRAAWLVYVAPAFRRALWMHAHAGLKAGPTLLQLAAFGDEPLDNAAGDAAAFLADAIALTRALADASGQHGQLTVSGEILNRAMMLGYSLTKSSSATLA